MVPPHCSPSCQAIRRVPPFSIQACQENTWVVPPPKINVFRPRFPLSQFRRFFLRGDIPVGRCYEKNCPSYKYLTWKVDPRTLDLSHFLPVFFEGLCESQSPYREMAIYGTRDLLCSACPDKVLECVPQLILPIKKALNTKNPACIIATLQALQQLVMAGPCIGIAFVPYFRKILPILNLFRDKNVVLGDRIEFNPMGQIGDVVEKTLNVLEVCGGPAAYANIKTMVPAYESCLLN